MFSSYLGSEDFDFILYHVRRTTATVLVHSFIPLGYYFGLAFASEKVDLLDPAKSGQFASIVLLIGLSSAFCGILTAKLWSWNNWKHHPLCKALASHGRTWMEVAAQINIEFRRIDKFYAVSGGCGVYVTDSWILKTSTYQVYVSQQTDSHLSIAASDQFAFSHETNQPTQYISIVVNSINPAVKPFTLRLNSLDYGELKDRLQAPLRNARNIVIHQSLSDRFVDAFKEQVRANGRYRLGSEMPDPEPCIGCMLTPANIKLQKNCGSTGENECRGCFCRPMWCIDCMGKWFASRQDQNDPLSWMSSLSPCPTCRSKFCMLDVCLIEN
ncbi:E3 ubiquitin-protein ligase TM129-like isoform X3 [Rhopilema esculentum]